MKKDKKLPQMRTAAFVLAALNSGVLTTQR
jgi:hypothetical protein